MSVEIFENVMRSSIMPSLKVIDLQNPGFYIRVSTECQNSFANRAV